MHTSAILSPCGTYRYVLCRMWDATKPTVLFICLNPSTADATVDDPTSRVCMNYARRWNYGTLLIGNLFALRSTTPGVLWNANDPIGPENDTHLQQMQAQAALVICAWGNSGKLLDRDKHVLRMLKTPYCLITLKSGCPGHPLYKRTTLVPMPLAEYSGVRSQESEC